MLRLSGLRSNQWGGEGGSGRGLWDGLLLVSLITGDGGRGVLLRGGVRLMVVAVRGVVRHAASLSGW